MVEKTDGAEMTCKSCGTELICHMSSYKGNFKNKLQWQNADGKAHYSTTNGKDFTCNIPEQEETTPDNEIELKGETQTITQETTTQETTTTAYVPPVNLDSVYDEIKLQQKMLESILHIVIDLKREVKEKNVT